MAKRRPSSSKVQASRGTEEDAFTAGILRFVAWARDKTQLLVVAAFALVLVVAAAIYGLNQRSARLDTAAAELEMLQQWVMFTEPEAAQAEVREYVERFSGTTYSLEARLLLAELLLEDGRAGEAVDVLEEVAPAYRTPLQVQATFLLAVAFEEAERWSDAVNLYQQLRDRADFTFQKREAGEGLARAHLAQGDSALAIQAYEEILSVLEPGHPQRPRFEMRLAELTAGSL